MRRLLKWLFILIGVVIALAVTLLLSRDSIAKTAMEQQIRAQTGLDVKIGKAKPANFRGHADSAIPIIQRIAWELGSCDAVG